MIINNINCYVYTIILYNIPHSICQSKQLYKYLTLIGIQIFKIKTWSNIE